jgi:hypothetical protein
MTIRDNILNGKYTNDLPFGNDTKNPNWQDLREAYYAEEARLTALFKADLEEEYGTADNPKRDDLFKLAWDYGHSGGFSQIVNYYDDLYELVK